MKNVTLVLQIIFDIFTILFECNNDTNCNQSKLPNEVYIIKISFGTYRTIFQNIWGGLTAIHS